MNSTGVRLMPEFYLRTDVLLIAQELLGKVLVTDFEGHRTAGLITETEAYRAPEDRASHAFGNRNTSRTEVMFRKGGCAYIYICYGIHHLFNVVTGPQGTAHAVLIRGIQPLEGLEWMLERRKADRLRPALTTGPGSLSQALGLYSRDTGQSLTAPDTPIWLEDRGVQVSGDGLCSGRRVGVESAGESALWEWRYWIKDNPYVKRFV